MIGVNHTIFHGILKFGEIITKKNRGRVVRYGSEYGGWYLPQGLGLASHDVCIAVGAGEDISFECELAGKFQGNIFILDPTPRAVVHYQELRDATVEGHKYRINNRNDEFYHVSADDLKRISYFQYGLSDITCQKKFYFPENEEWVSCSLDPEGKSEKFFEAECLKYADFLERHSIDRESIRVVKMDIEGSEYNVIRDMVQDNILPEVLCFEIHQLSKWPIYCMLHLFSVLWKAKMKLFYVTGQDILWVRKCK